MAAVLVHIDLDGERAHPSSLTALAAGRAVATSWGATLYAALVVHDASATAAPDATAQVLSTGKLPAVDAVRASLAKAGADKVVVALTDGPVAPLWAAIGGAWQAVLDHLRPRLVLFGVEAPSATELGPRTGARIGGRVLVRARAFGIEEVELRDRDGGYVRVSDSGAAVAMIGAAPRLETRGEDDIDVMVLAVPGSADARIELAGTAAAEIGHTTGTLIVVADEIVSDAAAIRAIDRLATLLGAHVVGSAAAAAAGVVSPNAVLDRHAPLAPDLCIAIGMPVVDLAGVTSLIRIGVNGGKGVDGTLGGPIATSLADLARVLEGS